MAFGCTVPNPKLTRDPKSVGTFLFLSAVIPRPKRIDAMMMVSRVLMIQLQLSELSRNITYKPMQSAHLFQVTACSHRGCSFGIYVQLVLATFFYYGRFAVSRRCLTLASFYLDLARKSVSRHRCYLTDDFWGLKCIMQCIILECI